MPHSVTGSASWWRMQGSRASAATQAGAANGWRVGPGSAPCLSPLALVGLFQSAKMTSERCDAPPRRWAVPEAHPHAGPRDSVRLRGGSKRPSWPPRAPLRGAPWGLAMTARLYRTAGLLLRWPPDPECILSPALINPAQQRARIARGQSRRFDRSTWSPAGPAASRHCRPGC